MRAGLPTTIGRLRIAGVEDLPADAPSPICSYSGALYQTHFYGVRGECIEQLIAFLEAVLTREPGHPLGGPMHVDGAYHMFRMQHPDASTLIANPNLATQRSSPSDVSPTWYDGVPVLKAAARIYRWAKRLRSGSGA